MKYIGQKSQANQIYSNLLKFTQIYSNLLKFATLIMLESFNYEKYLATQDLKLCFPFRAVRFS